MIEKTDIGDLKGIGEKTKKLFKKINVHTVGDLIRYYPHGYDVYEEAVPISELEEDKIQTVTGAIYGRVQVSGSSRMQVTTLHVKDLTGTLKVIWFRMPFLRNTLSGGGVITLRGRVVRKKTGDLVMEHPEMFYPSAKYEEKLHTLQPVYGLTAGLSNNMVICASSDFSPIICFTQSYSGKIVVTTLSFPFSACSLSSCTLALCPSHPVINFEIKIIEKIIATIFFIVIKPP